MINAIKRNIKKILGIDASKLYTDADISSLEKDLVKMDGKKLITSKRLDLVVRYLLFKDLVNNIENEEHLSLYSRMILSRTGAIEPLNQYSIESKEGIENHIAKAKELCNSIKKEGFKKDCFVPIDKQYALFNGAHRIAASIALDEKLWVKIYDNKEGASNFDFKWFEENNFTTEDKIRILRGFSDLYEKCGIFVLYAPIKDKWDYIERQISKKLNIVGSVEINFQNNYLAFENLIHDIYNSYSNDKNNVINRKIDLLKFSELKIKVILVSDEKNKDEDIHNQIRDMKNILRKTLKFNIDENSYLTLHSSDDEIEFKQLKSVVLSVNNLRVLNKRINTNYRKTFIKWLDDYKLQCKKHNIPLEKTCIVGSSTLEVLNIRESTDIDIVIPAELRLKYGDNVTHITPYLDICTKGYADNRAGLNISDDILINDDNYHFIFYGCKFANLDLVYKRKKIQARDKDLKDVQKINIFNDFSAFFDNKEVLKKQIKKELRKRK